MLFDRINRRYATSGSVIVNPWDESHGYRQFSLREKNFWSVAGPQTALSRPI
jgi:hypothetical protein